MTQIAKSLIDKDKQQYLQVYKRYPLALKKGKGAYVWDYDNKKYIDAFSGIAVNCLGHNHPKLVKAITKQAKNFIHVSNFYVTAPQVELTERLAKLSGMERIFFANSGAESVEGAIKLARKYAHSKGKGGKIISMKGCFHGRTLATIATGKQQYQKGFEPIPQGFEQVAFNDFQALEAAVNKDTAAILIEPVQGEGGINIANDSFLQKTRELCDKNNVVLIFDEVQCGVGRTGKFFAYEHTGVKPDIITLAKSLGGGVPIGAVLLKQEIANAIAFGEHGTTFGGNPLACAAANATLEIIQKENLIAAAEEKGRMLMNLINERAQNEPAVKDIRGKGLMIGVEVEADGRAIVDKMMHKGVLGNVTAEKVIRLVPPYIIKDEDLEKIVEVMFQSIKEVTKQ